jgi:hypothetical protein
MHAVALLAAAFALSSSFANGGEIPRRYTCDGSSAMPPLRWTTPPHGTRSLAIEVLDPDAPGGTFVHWVAWGVARGKPGVQGQNSTGGLGWTGPCPPSGPAHHYVFRLYALDATLRLRKGADDTAFRRALHGHVLATARLVGLYRRAA